MSTHSERTPEATLPGPSRTIIVEPIEAPREEPEPTPIEAPERDPDKEAEPEKTPA